MKIKESKAKKNIIDISKQAQLAFLSRGSNIQTKIQSIKC